MKKLRFFTPIMVVALLFILHACSDATNDDTQNESADLTELNSNHNRSSKDDNNDMIELGELTVGLMPSLDAFPIVIAYYYGYFADEGLTVNIETFSSGADRDAALQSGLLDATLFDLIAVGLSHEANITPLRVTGLTTGRFTLVANEGFKGIEDLAKETVVISQNTAIDFVLDQMVYLAGFDVDHVETIAIPAIPARLEYLREGHVAAALLPEPWATLAIAEGFKEITNTLEMEFIPFVTAFTDQAINTMPAEIRAFYRAYNRAIDFLNATDLADYFHIMVDVIGFPEEVASDLILPTFSYNQLPEDHVLEAAINWLLARDLITDRMVKEDLIHPVAFE